MTQTSDPMGFETSKINGLMLSKLLGDDKAALITFHVLTRVMSEFGIEFEHGASPQRYILGALNHLVAPRAKPNPFAFYVMPLMSHPTFMSELHSLLKKLGYPAPEGIASPG